MSEREYAYSVTFRGGIPDMFTLRADAVEDLNAAYGEIIDWINALTPVVESPQTPQETREPVYDDGGGVIVTVPEKKGARVSGIPCVTCNQHHDFYVNQRAKDGAWFLSIKRGNDWHYPVDVPIRWVHG